MTDAATVRAWLESKRVCTLSTILDDAHAPGFPFGTVVPYELVDGRVSIVISAIAVHTKNLRKDPRASIMIAEGDPQAGWRVTLVGKMRVVDENARTDVHDFSRWVLDVSATRWIAGFGKMGWY